MYIWCHICVGWRSRIQYFVIKILITIIISYHKNWYAITYESQISIWRGRYSFVQEIVLVNHVMSKLFQQQICRHFFASAEFFGSGLQKPVAALQYVCKALSANFLQQASCNPFTRTQSQTMTSTSQSGARSWNKNRKHKNAYACLQILWCSSLNSVLKRYASER